VVNNTVTPFRLSVLDQSPIAEGSSPGSALRNTLDLARLADKLGYYRYWLAEHHGTPALACNSPEALIGLVADATLRIRVGSGGVMLPHYSPLKVAETFSMLSNLFPERIDLGIGRAAGTSSNVALALQRDRRQPAPDDFHEQLSELLSYFGASSGARGPFPQLSIPLIRGEQPEIALLGSSPQSAIWAAELGLPYVFADFINAEGAAIARHYNQRFIPSERLPKPSVAVAVWAVCATTDEEARELSASLRMMMTMLFRGRPIPVPTVERAQRFIREEGVPLEMLPAGRRILTGSPANIRRALERVAGEYGVEEVMIVNIVHDHAARRRSYELIAQEFNLGVEPLRAAL
jgi:luciferase family oxidoreductase group 1